MIIHSVRSKTKKLDCLRESHPNGSNINEDLTLYRVGEVGSGTFFADNLDYYDHSMTDYNKKDAKAYSLDLSSAKVFDPMKDLGWDANTWSDIEGKVEDFEKFGIDYESDEGDTWGHTSTDDIAYAIQKLGYDVLILRGIRGDHGYGPAFNEYVIYNTNLLTHCKEINPTEKELKEDMDKVTISIKEFIGLTKPEIRNKIDSLPVDTLITGVRSHSDRSGMDIHIKKTSGYASNYSNPVGSPHDFKNMEVYWTIEGEKHPYIVSDIYQIVTGTNKYYKMNEDLKESNELEQRAKKHKKKSKGMGWHMSMNAGNVEKGIEVFNNSTGNVGTGDTVMSMGEAIEKKVYQYIGPVYYKGMLYRERVNLLTKATTRGRALANILYQAADGTELQYFDIEDNLLEEMPDNKETFTCDNCGHPLNDMGQCPACDQGEEELYEDLSSLEALWELSKLDNNV